MIPTGVNLQLFRGEIVGFALSRADNDTIKNVS